MTTPLKSIKVIDASRVLAGPLCAQTLAQLGATVLKLEHPLLGDETRSWGPPFLDNGLSAYFASCNQNKIPFPCDLKNPKDYKKFLRHLKSSQIFISNFLPADAKKLKIDYPTLKKIHPRLIYCNISGFGADSSSRHVPGYDFAIQALSGLMAITGPALGPPSKVGVAITDVQTALYATIAILAALQHPKRGCFIDMALLDCAVASQVNLMQAFLSTNIVPKRQGNAHLQIVPYQSFDAADQSFVLAVGNDRQFAILCEALSIPDLARRFPRNQDRVKHREVVISTLTACFSKRPFQDWSEILSKSQIPHAAIQDYAQLTAMPLAKERDWFTISSDGELLLHHPIRIRGRQLPRPRLNPKIGRQKQPSPKSKKSL